MECNHIYTGLHMSVFISLSLCLSLSLSLAAGCKGKHLEAHHPVKRSRISREKARCADVRFADARCTDVQGEGVYNEDGYPLHFSEEPFAQTLSFSRKMQVHRRRKKIRICRAKLLPYFAQSYETPTSKCESLVQACVC